MLPSSLRDVAEKTAQWVFVIALFILLPAAIIFGLRFILATVSGTSPNTVTDFSEDSAMILLSFWFGSLGAFVSYTFGRAVLRIEPDWLGMKVTKLVLGGSVAVAVFFFLKSGVLVKFFYPRLSVSPDSLMTTYHPTIIVCIIAGLFSPAIVERLQSVALAKKPAKSRTDDSKQGKVSHGGRNIAEGAPLVASDEGLERKH